MNTTAAETSPPRHAPVVPRTLPLFAGLEERVFVRLDAIARAMNCAPGTRVLSQDNLDSPFVVLVSGQLSTFRAAPDGDLVSRLLGAVAHGVARGGDGAEAPLRADAGGAEWATAFLEGLVKAEGWGTAALMMGRAERAHAAVDAHRTFQTLQLQIELAVLLSGTP